MRKQKRIPAFLLVLAILYGLAIPASAEYKDVIDITGAAAGGTTFVDYEDYTHTLSNPIQYILKAGDFYELPKNSDYESSDYDICSSTFDGKRQVLVVPTGTVLTMDGKVNFWDVLCAKVDERSGAWSLGKCGLPSNYPGEGVPSYTFSDSSTFYQCHFTLRGNNADETGQVYIYTLGPNGGFKAPGTSTTPATPDIPTTPVVTQQPTSGTGAKESPITVDPNAEAWGVDNSGLNNYTKYGRTVGSYLYQRPDGLLTRVHLIGTGAIVEVYDQNFQLLSTKQISVDANLMSGGFFAGANYNFLIGGLRNPNESDSQEVIRVMKYSKDWEFLGEASLKGANTTVPFSSGSLRCAEYNGFLYIRTCHQMYKSSDGKNHQANMNVIIRQSDMEIIENHGSGGYVSHSFNQFIIAGEDGTIVTLDHGDAYPRAAVLQRYQKRTDGWLHCEEEINLQEFPGATGDNETNASIGGLTESSSCYLAVGNLGTSPTSSRDVMLYSIGKSNFTSSAVRTVKLASYLGTATTGTTPQIVKISDNRFLVLWNERNNKGGLFSETGEYKLRYVFVDGSGNQTGAVQNGTGSLSDCQPILINGKVVWYSGVAFDNPTFYSLDASTGALTSQKVISGNPFTDVPDNAYYHDAVLWALKNGVTTGVTANQFQPKAACTRGQVVTFLWRAMGSPEPKTTSNPFTDVPSSSAFYKAVLWAYENQITSGSTPTTFNPKGTCTSGHVVTFLWRAEGQPAAAKPSTIAQKYPGAYYTDAVAWADSKGLLAETATAFNPSAQAARADIVTYLYHDLKG